MLAVLYDADQYNTILVATVPYDADSMLLLVEGERYGRAFWCLMLQRFLVEL